MDFPAFGDDQGYRDISQACAIALQNTDQSIFDRCYNRLRPLGIIAYHTAPYLLTNDVVSRNYVMLLLNASMLALIAISFFLIAKKSKDFFPLNTATIHQGYFYCASLALLLLMLVGHLPLYLSDLPAFAIFCVGLYCAFKFLQAPAQKKQRYLATAGVVLGIASLIKQNYIAYGFFAGIAICYIDTTSASGMDKFFLFAKRFSAFCLGFSITFTQFFWVYVHNGVFWPYLPSEYSAAASRLRSPPFLEMVLFTIPKLDSYVTQVTHEISRFTFYLTKIYLGMFKFDISVYMGIAPATAQITIGAKQVIAIYLSVFLYFAVTILTYLRGPLALRMLSLCAIGYTVFTAFSVHTEYRYYLFPRIVFYLSVIYSLYCLSAAIKSAYLQTGFSGVKKHLLGQT
jgi:hypothetical protein